MKVGLIHTLLKTAIEENSTFNFPLGKFNSGIYYFSFSNKNIEDSYFSFNACRNQYCMTFLEFSLFVKKTHGNVFSWPKCKYLIKSVNCPFAVCLADFEEGFNARLITIRPDFIIFLSTSLHFLPDIYLHLACFFCIHFQDEISSTQSRRRLRTRSFAPTHLFMNVSRLIFRPPVPNECI